MMRARDDSISLGHESRLKQRSALNSTRILVPSYAEIDSFCAASVKLWSLDIFAEPFGPWLVGSRVEVLIKLLKMVLPCWNDRSLF